MFEVRAKDKKFLKPLANFFLQRPDIEGGGVFFEGLLLQDQ